MHALVAISHPTWTDLKDDSDGLLGHGYVGVVFEIVDAVVEQLLQSTVKFIKLFLILRRWDLIKAGLHYDDYHPK